MVVKEGDVFTEMVTDTQDPRHCCTTRIWRMGKKIDGVDLKRYEIFKVGTDEKF
jgi:hypothetical protein